MRIVIIGAGGQVGSEVALMLTQVAGVEVVPIIRTRSGSAFLRYHGIPVVHGDITDPSVGARTLSGADVVANFALAGGTPGQARKQNDNIARAIFEHSNPLTANVFFSTLAVHGDFDAAGRRRMTAYGDLKRRNERLVTTLARRRRRTAYILRLGHVAGTYQALSRFCRDELLSPPVVVPNLERLANVTHTVTIADALVAIGSKRSGPPGLYDVVNVPQWTWRQVYDKEATVLGIAPSFMSIQHDHVPRSALLSRLTRVTLKAIGGNSTKDMLLRVLGRLPGSFDGRIRAEYYVDRSRKEIAVLIERPQPRNPATLWPALDVHILPGLSRTDDRLALSILSAGSSARIESWPPDLKVNPAAVQLTI